MRTNDEIRILIDRIFDLIDTRLNWYSENGSLPEDTQLELKTMIDDAIIATDYLSIDGSSGGINDLDFADWLKGNPSPYDDYLEDTML